MEGRRKKEKKGRTVIRASADELELREEKKDTIRVLCFVLSGEHYCIDINQAREVIRVTRITKAPGGPGFVVGAVNLHGEILPVMDIRYFFGLAGEKISESARVVVTEVKEEPVGILIDKLTGPVDVERGLIQPTLTTISGKLAECSRGQIKVGDEIVTFLDMAKITDWTG